MRKSVKSGATRVRSAEFQFVVVSGNDAVIAVIALKMAEVSPVLIDFPAN